MRQGFPRIRRSTPAAVLAAVLTLTTACGSADSGAAGAPESPAANGNRAAVARGAGSESAPDGGTAHGLVLGGDSTAKQILVMDAERPTWDPDEEPDAVKWRWGPTEENGFADVIDGWRGGAVSSRVRGGSPDGTTILLVDEYGFAGAVSYPTGERRWATDVPRDCGDSGADPCGPHAAELLPDGNIAVAASIGDWVRVYTASQGPDSTQFAQFDLDGAHGALWDPERNVLWAIGSHELVSLTVGGTPSAPELAVAERIALPGNQGGHDLAPVYGDTDKLWITINDAAYQYSKSTKEFRSDFPHAADVNERRLTKSIGNHPRTQQLLVTQAKKYDCPQSWCTPTADFFGDGDLDATRTLPGAQFYKLRWWVPEYQ